MNSLLEKLRDLLRGGSHDRAAVRRALEHCARRGRRLDIESARQSASHETMTATIEQVRDDDFIIDRPMIGTHVRPLAINEPLRISFFSGLGHCTGLTKPLSRYRFSSGGEGGGRTLYGYRMAIPEKLETVNRRRHHRVSLTTTATPIHVMLHPPGVTQPIKAVILDVSASGMRLRLEHDALLIDGQKMLMTGELPPPCGSIAEPVHVVRVTQCPRTSRPIVGVSFPEEAANVARYVRHLEILRARRAGAA